MWQRATLRVPGALLRSLHRLHTAIRDKRLSRRRHSAGVERQRSYYISQLTPHYRTDNRYVCEARGRAADADTVLLPVRDGKETSLSGDARGSGLSGPQLIDLLSAFATSLAMSSWTFNLLSIGRS